MMKVYIRAAMPRLTYTWVGHSALQPFQRKSSETEKCSQEEEKKKKNGPGKMHQVTLPAPREDISQLLSFYHAHQL